MKRFIAIVLPMLTLCLLLTGCDTLADRLGQGGDFVMGPADGAGTGTDDKNNVCTHSWTDATCTAPKTCSLCQETEGEALSHNWTDATCAAPKTCSRCQATEGEALSHAMAPANHQQPATCTLCGYAEGEKLTAFYAEKGVTAIRVENGKVYDYATACYTKPQKTTVGKLSWEDHQVFTEKEGYEAKDGYVWHTATLKIVYSDKNAQNYGFQVALGVDNYYTGDTTGFTDDGSAPFQILFNGKEEECLMIADKDAVSEWKDGACTYSRPYAWRVPAGFDGIVVLFYHAGLVEDDIYGMTDPAPLFFVFDATVAN